MPPAVGVEMREHPLPLYRIAVHVDAFRGFLVNKHEAIVGEVEGHVCARNRPTAFVVLGGAGQEPQADVVFRTPLPPKCRPLLGKDVNPPIAANKRDRLCLGGLRHLHERRQPALDVAIDL